MIYSAHLYSNFARCLVLRRAWNKDHQVWRTLHLYFGDPGASAKFLVSVGRVFCYQVRDFVCLIFSWVLCSLLLCCFIFGLVYSDGTR